MSETTAPSAGAAGAHEETVHGASHAHPGDRTYVGVAIVLAVITAAEVASFYLEDSLGALLVPALIVMMVAKFAIVAMFFMHLRFDSPLFRRLFVAGIVTAVAVYIAALTMFEFWSDGDNLDTSTGGGETVGMVHVSR